MRPKVDSLALARICIIVFVFALGHFTQVVWKDSRNFGIAKARSKSGKIIVVANYDPPGNFLGQYKDNVKKAKWTGTWMYRTKIQGPDV